MDKKISRGLFICTSLTPLFFYPLLDNIFILPKYTWIFLITTLFFAVNLKRNLFNSRPIFILPAGIFLLWNILLLFRCVNIFIGLHTILLLILFIIFYITFENLVVKNPEYDFLLKTICIVTIVVSTYGLMQITGLDFFKWEIKQSPLSTLGRRNFSAEYIVMVIPYLYYLCTVTKNNYRRKFWIAVLVLVILHLIFTFTRASYLGFFGSTLLFFVVARKDKLFSAHKQVLYILLGLFLLTRPSFSAIKGFEKGTINSRLRMYMVSFQMLKNNPFFGVGPGNFSILYPLYTSNMGGKGLISGELMVTDLHNDLLEIAVNLGIPGLLFFLFILFYAGRISFLLYRKCLGKEKVFVVAVVSSITAVLINSLASFPFKMPATTLLFWINLALLGSLYRKQCIIPVKKYNIWAFKSYFIFFLVTGIILNYRALSASFYIGKAERTKGITSLEYAEKAVRYHPFSYEYNFLAGKYAINNKEYKKALDYLTTAKKYHPYFNVIYNNLGIVYFNTGYLREAEESYLYSIKLNPYHADVYNNLGVLYAHQGRYNEAIWYFHQAVQKKENFYTACFNLGLTYYSTGNYDLARVWFEKTLSINPYYHPAKQYLNKLNSPTTPP